MKTTKPCLVLLTALCVMSAAVLSQPAPPLSTNAGAFVHQITVEPGDQETRYRQIVSPVTLSIPIAMGSLNIQSAYMYLEEQTATGTRDASGPLDTQVSGEWNVGRSLFTGYVNIPTGNDSLDTVEADLARGMSRNDLNFPIKTFGQGLDVGGALTLAHQLNHWTVSVGGGYVVRGTYAPLATASDYDPGDELTFTTGIGYATGGWTLGVDTAGKLIYVDRLQGEPIFRNGKQLVAKGSLSYESRKLRLDATVTEIARLKNREMVDGALLYEDRDSNGNDLRARGKISLTPIPGITVFGEGEFKDVSENAYDPTSSLFQAAARLWAYGGGLSVRLGATEALTIRVVRGDGWLNDRAEDVETLNAHIAVRLFF